MSCLLLDIEYREKRRRSDLILYAKYRYPLIVYSRGYKHGNSGRIKLIVFKANKNQSESFGYFLLNKKLLSPSWISRVSHME